MCCFKQINEYKCFLQLFKHFATHENRNINQNCLYKLRGLSHFMGGVKRVWEIEWGKLRRYCPTYSETGTTLFVDIKNSRPTIYKYVITNFELVVSERVRNVSKSVCLSPFLDTLTIFLAINNTLSDSNAKKRVENPMRTKVLLVKRLSKMRSKITYVYVKHLKRTKTHRFERTMFILVLRICPASCNQEFLDTTYFLKQNTICHNSVKVSDPILCIQSKISPYKHMKI